MQRDPRVWLADVVDACRAIESVVARIDLETYLADRTLRSATEREFIIIGEAMARIRDHTPDLFAEVVHGSKVIGLRNELTHAYATIDAALIWAIATRDVTPLKELCIDILARLDAPTEGAGGLVFDPAGRVLLLRRDNGEWMFPKGHIDPGEDHLTTALREVEEEAGVSATCPDPDARWTTRYVNDRGVPREVTWFRLAAPEGATPTLREALFPEGAFLAVPEALQRLTFEEDRRLLRAVAGDEEAS